MKYKSPSWSVGQHIRTDRLDKCVEEICAHGIGHPNSDWAKTQDDWSSVHGCDGCCKKE